MTQFTEPLQHPLTDQELEAWKTAKEAALLNRIAELEQRVTALEGRK